NRRNVGEPPHVLDSSLVELSAQQIGRFLQTKGYFNARVTPQISVKKKKAHIDFDVALGQPFQLGHISYQADDPGIAQLYAQEVRAKSTATPGKQFDSSDLLQEREQLYQAMRIRGHYHYRRQHSGLG